MEELSMAHQGDFNRRIESPRKGIEAYQAAAWRAPAATRFDSRPANDFAANDLRHSDFLARADAVAPRSVPVDPMPLEPMPRWLIVAIGAAIAALLGALLGGALAVY